MKIAVVGTGYVGLVAGTCFADAGHHVLCLDLVPEKIKMLEAGQSPIYEPGLEELLERNIKSGRLKFSMDLGRAAEEHSLLFIAVGTPEGPDGRPDLSALLGACDQIARSAKGKKYVVLKSTVPIGTARILSDFFRKNCKHAVEIINNPEFLKEGTAVDDFLRPDRVVIGCASAEAQQVMEEIYDPFVKNGHPILFMDNTSAEMTKYAANSFLSVKISFINELAQLADRLGADIDQVRRGFTSDRRINPAFFYPGVGYGGSCFPKDVQALLKTAQDQGLRLQITEAADKVNDEQKWYVYSKLEKHFGSLKGRKIAVWGLSFKPRTDDVREAPAYYLIQRLLKEGALVTAYDPIAGPNAVRYWKLPLEVSPDPMACVQGAEALLVTTEWNEFRNPDFEELKKRMKTPVIVDGRNVYDPEKIRSLGFHYYCVGRQVLAGGQNG